MPVVLEICQGTTCFVMGSSELMIIDELLPVSWRDKVEIKGTPCLNRCKNNRYGKAPFVRLDGVVYESAQPGAIMLQIAEKLGDKDFRLPEELTGESD